MNLLPDPAFLSNTFLPQLTVMKMQSLVELLRAELDRRISKNSNYSLRSFANFLDIDPSHLSRLMQAKRKVSYPLAKRICQRLSLDPNLAEALRPQYSWDAVSGIQTKNQSVHLRLTGSDAAHLKSVGPQDHPGHPAPKPNPSRLEAVIQKLKDEFPDIEIEILSESRPAETEN